MAQCPNNPNLFLEIQKSLNNPTSSSQSSAINEEDDWESEDKPAYVAKGM